MTVLGKTLGIIYSGQHRELAMIADASYDFSSETARVGTAIRNDDFTTSSENGFQGCVYEMGDTVVVAYRGSDEGSKIWGTKDWCSNHQMMNDEIPEQYQDAVNLYTRVATDPKYAGKRIVVTGHSLGGSLAELVSATKFNGVKTPSAVTFNAYGTEPIIRENPHLNSNNSNTNYYISTDTLVGASREHNGPCVSLLSAENCPSIFSAHDSTNFSNAGPYDYIIANANRRSNSIHNKSNSPLAGTNRNPQLNCET